LQHHKSTSFEIFVIHFWHFHVLTLRVRVMLKLEESDTPPREDGFAARLRQVVDSYGSTCSLARNIERSEGAVRKWLRGLSEPNVTDLRAICQVTGTSVEWLVMGRGEQRAMVDDGDPTLGVGESRGPQGASSELPPVSYKLMDQVVRSIRDESPVLLGSEVTAEKQSSVIATVYNMSRRTRSVDTEEVSRIVGLMA
jgi:transcriptional regulator with XRE-family HTH domain